MTVETLTTFFGWMAVINIAYLALVAVAVMGMQSWMIGVHQRMFGLEHFRFNLVHSHLRQRSFYILVLRTV